MRIRLISWNISGWTKKSYGDAQIGALRKRRSDLVALQEVTDDELRLFQRELPKLGLGYVQDCFGLSPSGFASTRARFLGMMIASRWPIHLQDCAAFAIPWPERVLAVGVKCPFGKVRLYGVHIPHGDGHPREKIEMLEGIFAGLTKPQSTPAILCGDFNTPQCECPSGEIITWGQEEMDDRFEVYEEFKGVSGPRWDRAERNLLERLARHELPDVDRHLNGPGTMDFSWYPKGAQSRRGRRYDHIFAAPRLNPVQCHYLHEYRETGLSDHSPIEAVFQPLRVEGSVLIPEA